MGQDNETMRQWKGKTNDISESLNAAYRSLKATYRKVRAWPSKVLTVVHIWGEWSERQCQLKGRCIQQRYRSLPKRDFFRPKSRSGIDRYFLFRQTGPLCSLKMKIIKKLKKLSQTVAVNAKTREKLEKFCWRRDFFLFKFKIWDE